MTVGINNSVFRQTDREQRLVALICVEILKRKESKFSRKMELNIEIKKLEQNKIKLLGGNQL